MGKNTTTKNEYFLKSNFVGVNRLFFLIYLNGNIDVKSYKARSFFYQTVPSIIITSSSWSSVARTSILYLKIACLV